MKLKRQDDCVKHRLISWCWWAESWWKLQIRGCSRGYYQQAVKISKQIEKFSCHDLKANAWFRYCFRLWCCNCSQSTLWAHCILTIVQFVLSIDAAWKGVKTHRLGIWRHLTPILALLRAKSFTTCTLFTWWCKVVVNSKKKRSFFNPCRQLFVTLRPLVTRWNAWHTAAISWFWHINTVAWIIVFYFCFFA